MQLQHGTIIEQRYEVVVHIATGGFAEVYRLRDLRTDRFVALKVLREPGSYLSRFRREARLLSGLKHPNLVRFIELVDLGRTVGILMDFVDGPTLRQLLRSERPGPQDTMRLGEGILSGMAVAHAAGLVHRDIKPSNILLKRTSSGLIPQIADFGLVKNVKGLDEVRTVTGTRLGTPGYMAPEQLRDAARADARADVFSLGCVLYELLCGQRPFNDKNPMLYLYSVHTGDFPAPKELNPSLPDELVQLLNESLQTKPGDRPSSAGVLLERWQRATVPGQMPALNKMQRAALTPVTAPTVTFFADARGAGPADADVSVVSSQESPTGSSIFHDPAIHAARVLCAQSWTALAEDDVPSAKAYFSQALEIREKVEILPGSSLERDFEMLEARLSL
ncbi:MAG: serine/threonine-protein kinase [Myxococcota bacterium]